jgi:hypothetical protein
MGSWTGVTSNISLVTTREHIIEKYCIRLPVWGEDTPESSTHESNA